MVIHPIFPDIKCLQYNIRSGYIERVHTVTWNEDSNSKKTVEQFEDAMVSDYPIFQKWVVPFG